MAEGPNPPTPQPQAAAAPKPKPKRPPTPQPQAAAAEAPEEQGRGPQTHVVGQGDQIREPDELENLERQPAPPEHAIDSRGIEERLGEFIQQATALRVNERVWKDLSAFTRYAITGAKVLAQEVLGERDDHGRTASMRRTLGFDIATGKTVGHGT